MKILSQQAAQIDTYINSSTNVKVGESKIEIGGEPQKLPYFRFPLSMLHYSVENGRLAMEVKEWEREHNRTLNAEHKSDADIIREMLLKLILRKQRR